MNTKIIESQIDLRIAFLEAIKGVEEPEFKVIGNDSPPWDFIVETTLDGIKRQFAVACKLRPSLFDIQALSQKSNLEPRPILATVEASETILDHCRNLGVGCIDLNGRIWLRAHGIIIDRKIRTTNRFRTAEVPVNFFSLKSSRLARALLSFPNRQWTQPELADFTGLSQGLVSKLLRHASHQGWVGGEGSRGRWIATAPDALLDAWKVADLWDKRSIVRQYSVLGSGSGEIAKRILDGATGQVAFTQWFAANHRLPYTENQVISAYLAEIPDDAFIEKLGARQVNGGGKVWLITPKDTGIFQAIRCVDGFPVVCDVQIYLDLLQVGLRGPDQAEALRVWEGFCKP